MLRTELRRARQQAELSQEQVAQILEWAPSKIIHIETGTVGISAGDLGALLSLYNVQESDEVDRLLALAQAGRERPWQHEHWDVVSSRLLQFIEFESAASISRNFQPLMIPGLLQTREYAQILLEQFSRGQSAERIEAAVEVRMRRQEILDGDEGPLLFFIVDEAAVRRVVGNRRLMRRQLDRLSELAGRERITVEVVPFGAGAYPALNGSFVVHEFADTADDDVLYREGPQGEELVLDDTELITRHREIFEELRRLSPGPDESLAFLNQLAADLGLLALNSNSGRPQGAGRRSC
jgi:transcriptional regulator with XRE-family HTH domain